MKPKPSFEYPIHDLLQKRWSPRSFSDKSITFEDLMCLFEAARWAASGMNEQPWRFIYAFKEDKEKYEKILSCLFETNKIWAISAPILVITLIKKFFEKNNAKNDWAMHDLGLAIGNLTTQASSQNLFVHNMSGFSAKSVKNIFNIPDNMQAVTIIAIGYLGNADLLPDNLKEREESQQKRKPLKDLFIY